jgi:hypothetical protein
VRHALAVLALTVVVSGCTGGGEQEPRSAAATYSADVRETFLSSCVENATRTSDGTATAAQLQQTCTCILGKVEQTYSEAEFTAFEKRLLGGDAAPEESSRLVDWSTACAKEATS